MFSVALDEAISLRATGSLIRAREQTSMAADLLDRLAAGLCGALRALEEQGRHLGALPEVLPFDSANFRGTPAQDLAEWNLLLHRVLFGARSRFFHKISVLDELVTALALEFREIAEEIAEGTSVRPERRWASLDSLHYDLNTCLRETIVVLKSFLVFLPAEQVESFGRRLAQATAAELRARPSPVRRPVFSRTRR